jgi:hypothetical protein
MPDSSRLKTEAVILYDKCYEISYYNNYRTHAACFSYAFPAGTIQFLKLVFLFSEKSREKLNGAHWLSNGRRSVQYQYTACSEQYQYASPDIDLGNWSDKNGCRMNDH